MKTKYILDKKTFPARAAIVSLLLAVIFRLIGTVGHFSDLHFLVYRFALPAVSCILYVLTIIWFGRKGFWTSFFPFIMGVLFFIVRLLDGDSSAEGEYKTLGIVIAMLVYLLIVAVYSCTIFGAIKTKIFIVILFTATLAYHIVYVDYPAIAGKTASAEAIFMELGVLCMLLGMFFASVGLKKQTKASSEKSEGITPPIPGGNLVHSSPAPADDIKEENPVETEMVLIPDSFGQADDIKEEKPAETEMVLIPDFSGQTEEIKEVTVSDGQQGPAIAEEEKEEI